jgi:hypothetical protein
VLFNLDGMHKHADPIFIAAQNQSCEFIIRKKTYSVCACGECLTTDNKVEEKRYKTIGFSLLIRAALELRLRKSEPATFVSTIILKMRTASEIGLALQSFRNSAKRAGRIDTKP